MPKSKKTTDKSAKPALKQTHGTIISVTKAKPANSISVKRMDKVSKPKAEATDEKEK